MYNWLLIFHSGLRWIALGMLLLAIVKFSLARRNAKAFGKLDNALRHWTATVFHVQLVVGLLLYFFSPAVDVFWKYGARSSDALFFAILHSSSMFAAVMLITFGSAFSKRETDSADKFKVALRWFLAALIIILLFIPWPFSPLAARPYFR